MYTVSQITGSCGCYRVIEIDIRRRCHTICRKINEIIVRVNSGRFVHPTVGLANRHTKDTIGIIQTEPTRTVVSAISVRFT